MNPTSPYPSSSACTGATDPANRPWSSTASACPRPWTTGPLRFEEFNQLVNQIVYVSATPADYEIKKADGEVVEQIIRPTGLMDPIMEVRPAESQVDDLLDECRNRAEAGERVLVTTLTKRMAENLTEHFASVGLKVRYLHSDIKTIERTEILRDLRKGVFDILIGINLLREGLDLPEVSLVAILDADKEGFLRSRTVPHPDRRPGRPQRRRSGSSFTPPN